MLTFTITQDFHFDFKKMQTDDFHGLYSYEGWQLSSGNLSNQVSFINNLHNGLP